MLNYKLPFSTKSKHGKIISVLFVSLHSYLILVLVIKKEILFKNENLRHFMGQKSREKALSMSWANMSTNMVKVYRDVVAENLVTTNI